ncbi:MAG: ABC transporter ATP-binding protein [Thermodesulfobacteriota bacterium]|nr:ABC transporter ATP-binding protein [Thermodesulfobacteriota bacterium]
MLLEVNNIQVIYEHIIMVLRGFSLQVPEKSIIALLGANGAGKSTCLKAISGLLMSENGEITMGNILFEGQRIDGIDAARIVRLGIVQVMEGRQIFEELTVEENLKTGLHIRRKGGKGFNLDMIYDYFPALKVRRNSVSGYCSGGEQQMMVIGRALLTEPKLLLLDEPSLGLAPLIAEEVFSIIVRLNQELGVDFLLVEQNAQLALSVATYGYVMENGLIVLEGPTDELRDHKNIKEFYLGVSDSDDKRSYRDIKYYTRKKRWFS